MAAKRHSSGGIGAPHPRASSLVVATSNELAHLGQERAGRGCPVTRPGTSESIERAVLAAVLDPVITIDASGTIQSASDSVQRVFGWTPAELLGRNVNVLMPDPHRAAHDGYLANYRRTGQTNILGRPREFEAVRKSGDRFPIELAVSRVEATDGAMPLFVGIIRDISAHKRLERETLLLKDLALRIGGTSNIAEARLEALRLIGSATGWDYGEVWVPAGDHLVGVAQWVRPGSGLEAFARTMADTRIPKAGSLAGRAWDTAHPIWNVDLSGTSGIEVCRRRAALSAGLRAAAAIPVVADGAVKKVLLFFAQTTRPDDLHTLELVRAAAALLETLIERKRAEELLRESEVRVSSELAAMTSLHELVHRLLGHREIKPALADVLDSAISLTGAAMGHVQLLDGQSGFLSIAVQRGFHREFLEHFASVSIKDGSACGRALRSSERVIIEDVQADRLYAPHKRAAAEAGYRAVQSTPLVASNGNLLGILSTHYAGVHRPSERNLRILDLHARQAADFIERTRAQQQLDEYRHSLEQRVEERTRALEESQQKLRMADRMASIGTLAAGLGHDMNNVLLPVRARLNALKASSKLPGAETEHVREVQKSVAYLQQLADGLHFLALDPETDADARGGGGTTDLHQWWSQAGAILSKAVPKHVRVSAVFPSGLPQAAVPAHGLTQAVLNLVVNAGEAIGSAAERKRRQGHVRIWMHQADPSEGAWLHVGVTDNGSGMSEEVKRHAFEMFFTTKPRGLGTGLGLALVHKVVDRAGGRVEIKSQVGKGTTVLLILPIARQSMSRADERCIDAVISVSDGRAAALVRHMLESAGVRVRDGDWTGAALWVTDPAAGRVNKAKAWRADNPRGQLVLFGRPSRSSAAAWEALRPVTLETPDDLEAVRTAIAQAVSALEGTS